MHSNHSDHFAAYSDEQLFEVVLNKDAYRQEEVSAALEEVQKRGKASELASLIQGQLASAKEEPAGTAAAWHRINPRYSISLYPGSLQQIQFERALLEHNIPYRLQDTNNFSVPVARYLFTEEDFPKVQELYETLSPSPPGTPASFAGMLAEIGKYKCYLIALLLFVLLAVLLLVS
ncbi:hypothetical protein CLV24_12072 [Pontibacter ummariensis]|uniref:Uncharacterized protein n=1 Tax=Pontibacter ummariensis TaxID=1610492 RepID=A0A239J6Y7_9BACT|nr:hypothetical protein [Pontibacter ummariensis]PRY08904.1 hypothetical protein CLV24_12072 [Pontibacter ummariensis]SNT01432.1 hypothetical protein SAMN06296052_12071 [Pontibacter ummariensis]